jgi:tRNA(fMet)-specific endonuclease VapC
MTTLYMLNTDTCAFVLRRSSEPLLLRIQAVPIAQQCMSVVSYAELLYGVEWSSQKKTNQAAVEMLARHVSVLDWPQEAAQHYAQIRADLKKTGSMVGANDLMIAAHARSLRATVVTNKTKDFERIKGLNIENWQE